MKRVSLAVMLLAAIALVVNTVFVDSRTRPAMARDGGQLIETPVVTANVKVEGNGPAIVFIHGFGAAIDWWDEIAPTLAKDHRAIRVDLIGHGGTAAPASGYTIEQQAALVSAILDKLGVERVTVIAHSMGGEVATAPITVTIMTETDRAGLRSYRIQPADRFGRTHTASPDFP